MKAILVIDDEYALTEALVELLEDEGYRVMSAANGLDALDRLRETKPDLIITDDMMPLASGKEFIRRLRALPDCRSIPVVMMSSAREQVARDDGAGGQIQLSAFLAKPFLLDDLLRLVEGLIGKAARGNGQAPAP